MNLLENIEYVGGIIVGIIATWFTVKKSLKENENAETCLMLAKLYEARHKPTDWAEAKKYYKKVKFLKF